MEYETIHPAEVKLGDIIGTADVNHHPFVVEHINGPQSHGVTGTTVVQWTVEGIDVESGKLRTASFREGLIEVRRYQKSESSRGPEGLI